MTPKPPHVCRNICLVGERRSNIREQTRLHIHDDAGDLFVSLTDIVSRWVTLMWKRRPDGFLSGNPNISVTQVVKQFVMGRTLIISIRQIGGNLQRHFVARGVCSNDDGNEHQEVFSLGEEKKKWGLSEMTYKWQHVSSEETGRKILSRYWQAWCQRDDSGLQCRVTCLCLHWLYGESLAFKMKKLAKPLFFYIQRWPVTFIQWSHIPLILTLKCSDIQLTDLRQKVLLYWIPSSIGLRLNPEHPFIMLENYLVCPHM